MQWGVLGESALLEGQCNAMDTQQPTAAVQNDGAAPMCTKNDGFLTVGPKWSIGAIARNQKMGKYPYKCENQYGRNLTARRAAARLMV